MFRRRAQRAMRRMGNPNVPPVLQRANKLMQNEEYQEAADLFQELAQGAEERFPQRAPFLYFEAGHAAILSGQSKIGVGHLRRGLTLFSSQGRIARMQMAGHRIIDELQARGMNAEAMEISLLLEGNTPAGISAAQPTPPKRPILPTHCPSCGAAVRPDDVEWLDDVTAECDYCGSPVRAED